MEKTDQPSIMTESSASPLPPPPAPTVPQPSPTSTGIASLASTATSHSFNSRTSARTRAMVSSAYQYLRVCEGIFSLNRLQYVPSHGCYSSGLFIKQAYQNYLFNASSSLTSSRLLKLRFTTNVGVIASTSNFQRRDNKASHFAFEIITLLKECHVWTSTIATR